MAMRSSDFDSDGEPVPDPRLRDGLRSLSIPETPPDLESCVRRLIRRRRVRRVLTSGSVCALVIAALVWRPWGEVPVAPTPAREIPADQLAVLFAPPPVDRLAVLDGQSRRFVAALNRLEEVK